MSLQISMPGLPAPPRRALLLVALAAPFALGACSGASRAAATAPSPAPVTAAARRDTTPDYAAIIRARTDSARRLWTEADARFMTDMIGHHAQAIVMSRLAPDRTDDPGIRTLAARIINAQHDEIGRMQTWLRDRNLPVPDVDTTGSAGVHAGHHGTHHGDHALMPGMLTQAELDELAASRGRDFDRLFLASMIKHHRGAISMVEQLFGSYGAGQDEDVFRLATDINVDQITEIRRMEQMLLALLMDPGAR